MTALLLVMLAAPPKLSHAAEKAAPPAEVAEPLRKLLAPGCDAVKNEDGTLLAEFWFREAWPTTAAAEQVKNGLTYRDLTEGAFAGVVRFPKAFTDYRKQDIPAGTYTLRLAVQPDVGDHKDTAPHADFLLVCPAAKDATDDALEAKPLIKLSATVTGGDHPAVMLLYPHREKAGPAALVTQRDGATTLAVYRPVSAGDAKATLGLAVVVAGHSAKR